VSQKKKIILNDAHKLIYYFEPGHQTQFLIFFFFSPSEQTHSGYPTCVLY